MNTTINVKHYRVKYCSYHYLSLCIVFQTTPPSTGVSVPPGDEDTDSVSEKSINKYTVTCVCVLLE